MRRISRLLGENLFDPAELAGPRRDPEHRARGHLEVGRAAHAPRSTSRGCRSRAAPCSIPAATSPSAGTRRTSCGRRAWISPMPRAWRWSGELMASIAHEINQPLTAILANAGAGLRRLRRRGQRRAGASRDLRRHPRPGPPGRGRHRTACGPWRGKRPLERQALDVNEVAGEIARLVGATRGGAASTLRTELRAVAPGDRRRPRVPAAGPVESDGERDGRDGSAWRRAERQLVGPHAPAGRRRRGRGQRHRPRHSRPTACPSSSTPSSRPRRRVSASASRSRARSSRRTADGSGPRTTADAAPRST